MLVLFRANLPGAKPGVWNDLAKSADKMRMDMWEERSYFDEPPRLQKCEEKACLSHDQQQSYNHNSRQHLAQHLEHQHQPQLQPQQLAPAPESAIMRTRNHNNSSNNSYNGNNSYNSNNSAITRPAQTLANAPDDAFIVRNVM